MCQCHCYFKTRGKVLRNIVYFGLGPTSMPRSWFYQTFICILQHLLVISVDLSLLLIIYLLIYFLATKLHRVRWYSTGPEQVGMFQNELEYLKSCTLGRTSKISAIYLFRFYLLKRSSMYSIDAQTSLHISSSDFIALYICNI